MIADFWFPTIADRAAGANQYLTGDKILFYNKPGVMSTGFHKLWLKL